jgi:CRP/FNR family cyclic AMP-dependent transcriptional regulator
LDSQRRIHLVKHRPQVLFITIWAQYMITEAAFQKFVRVYARDEVVFRENSPGKEMFIVYSGKINLYKERQDKVIPLSTVGPGDFFGEMALIDGSPRSATAIAAEDTQLIVLDEPKFLYLLRHQPEFALVVMQKLCEGLRRTTEGWADERRK